MAIPSSRRLSSVALFIYLLLAFVIGGYLYFSQFHIPQREANLVDQGVRTLANIEERIVFCSIISVVIHAARENLNISEAANALNGEGLITPKEQNLRVKNLMDFSSQPDLSLN